MEDRFNIEIWFNNPLVNMALDILNLSRDVYTIIQSVSKKDRETDYSVLLVAKPSLKSC